MTSMRSLFNFTYCFTICLLIRSKSDIDIIFQQYIILPEDGNKRSELVYDHRVKNARPIEEWFEEFYLELDGMLEKFGKAAEERRASMVVHLPFAA